jgi:hypothetical protein
MRRGEAIASIVPGASRGAGAVHPTGIVCTRPIGQQLLAGGRDLAGKEWPRWISGSEIARTRRSTEGSTPRTASRASAGPITAAMGRRGESAPRRARGKAWCITRRPEACRRIHAGAPRRARRSCAGELEDTTAADSACGRHREPRDLPLGRGRLAGGGRAERRGPGRARRGGAAPAELRAAKGGATTPILRSIDAQLDDLKFLYPVLDNSPAHGRGCRGA